MKLITFTILAIVMVILAIITIIIALIAGASTVVIFGDLIICIVLIWAIIRGIKKAKGRGR